MALPYAKPLNISNVRNFISPYAETMYAGEICIGYIRVSSKPQEVQGGSLEEQEAVIKDYIAQCGMKLIDFF